MFKPSNSLYSKIILRSLVNILLVLGALIAFFMFQTETGRGDFFRATMPDRLRFAAKVISRDLSKNPMSSWTTILKEQAKNFSIDFILVLDKTSYSSTGATLQPSIYESCRNFLDNLAHDTTGHKEKPFMPHVNNTHKQAQRNHPFDRDTEKRLSLKTLNPDLYWYGTAIYVYDIHTNIDSPAVIFAVSDSITGNGFFFDPTPWIVLAVSILLISILLWIPLIKTITLPLKTITAATEIVGRGQFSTRLDDTRKDEIGRLAKAINEMVKQLSLFVDGQKQFLRDISHEVRSPIARIQFGLAALEQRVDDSNQKRIKDILGDVDHLSILVSELLDFARAENAANKVDMQPVNVAQLVQTVLLREAKDKTSVDVNIDADLLVEADPRLLARAIGNVVRNAIVHAAGILRIRAKAKGKIIAIDIVDTGPGVPEDSLNQLFDPFFRIEKARSPGGGTGLGLAIAKTCVTACGGTIFARNIQPSGLMISIHLKPIASVHKS